MSKIRTLFLGTPDFAVTCLKALLNDPHYEIVGVVTQPDKPRGRNLQLQPSPVKVLAMNYPIPIFSPAQINAPDVLDNLTKLKAEVAVVVAFGQILSQRFLDLFPYGAVNLHASLLPEWRGAAPIQRALEAGDQKGGITLQKIVKELDAGDIIGLRKKEIPLDKNALSWHEDLAQLGVELLHIELMDYLRGNLIPQPQDHLKATYASKILKTESPLNWSKSSVQLHNQIRGFLLGPGSWTTLEGKRIKIIKSFPHPTKNLSSNKGDLFWLSPENTGPFSLFVQTDQGCLEILELQPEGSKRLSAAQWWQGLKVKPTQFI